MEEKVVDDIVNNNQTDYTPYFQIPLIKTEEEIDNDRIAQNKQVLEGELAKNERDFEITDDIEAKNKHDLIKSAIDPGDGILTNEDITPLDYINTERNEPAAPQRDPSALKGIGSILQGLNETINSEPNPPLPELEWIPEGTYVEPAVVRPDLQDILTIENETNDDAIEEIKNFKDEVKTEFDEIFDSASQTDATEFSDNESEFPEMPEIFSDEDFDDTEFEGSYIPKPDNTYALIPTDVKIEDGADPPEILGDPNANAILPPLTSPTVAAITPYHTDEEDLEDPGYTDADIDFQIIEDPIPFEIDEDKIVVDDGGDVMITEPENAGVEFKSLVPYYNQIVELPPEVEMQEPRTRNLVLKRKLPQDETVNIKKYITGTDVRTRDVWDAAATAPAGGDEPRNIKPAIRKKLATVDVHTIRRLPWVDFSVILRETDAERREQVIMDILQQNLPESNDIYYIYHDQESNTFSIEVDETADVVQDLIEEIYVIDAQLKVQDLSAKERKELKRIRRLKREELEKKYGARTVSRILSNKMTPEKKREAEEKIFQIQQELNQGEEEHFYRYNEDTEEFELVREDAAADIARRITAAILRTDNRIENSNSRSEKKTAL